LLVAMGRPRTKSFAFLISLLLVGIIFGFLFQAIDRLLGFPRVLPDPDNLTGLVIVVIGSWLRFWAGSVFYGKNRSMVSFKVPPNLVTKGPWKYSRNPLYLGLILIGLGFSFFFFSYSYLLLTLVGIGLLQLEIRNEEKVLTQSFGEEYLEYKKHVRKWI